MNPESERLLYERIIRGHAVEMQAELCDPRVYAHIDDHQVPTPNELLESFARKEAGSPSHRSSETWIDCAVRLKDTEKIIGRIEATVLEDRAEVAYLFGFSHWGFGYAREALDWLQVLLAQEHAVREFWATVAPGNQRSIALLKRLGYAEAQQANWPDKLSSYNEGDFVYHRVASWPRDVA